MHHMVGASGMLCMEQDQTPLGIPEAVVLFVAVYLHCIPWPEV